MAKDVRVNVEECFDVIKKLQKYANAINGVHAGADVDAIKVVNDLRQLLALTQAIEMERFLKMRSSPEFKREIGYTQGYNSSFSVDKLNALVKQVVDAKQRQDKMTATQLRDWLGSYESALQEKSKEIEQLERKITDLLRFQEELLLNAKDKTRITARRSKRKYDELRSATIDLITRQRTGRSINVNELVQKLRD